MTPDRRSADYLRDINWWRLVDKVGEGVDARMGAVAVVHLRVELTVEDRAFILSEATRRFGELWTWRMTTIDEELTRSERFGSHPVVLFAGVAVGAVLWLAVWAGVGVLVLRLLR